jgi:hypothetical protein
VNDETASSSEHPTALLPQAIGSSLFAAAGFVVFLLALIETMSFSPAARPFPRLVSIVGMVAAGIAFARSCQAALGARREAGPMPADGTKPSRRDLAISYFGPPAYGVMLFALGFWAASALFLAGLLVLLGERRPALVIAITGGTLGAIYLVFEIGFGIRLPGSLLVQALTG